MKREEFFADWTIRHPDIENGELLQHCGPWPMSVAQEKPELTYPLAFEHPGSLTAEAKTRRSDTVPLRWRQWRIFTSSWKRKRCGRTERNGNISLGRSGKHQTSGSQDCRRTVYSPLCRHSQKSVVPVLYEACKYIGVKPDLYDPIEEDVKAYLRGE